MESDGESTMVIFFDVLFGLCVVATLWFAGYAVYRVLKDDSPRK
ncbi:hypothetical protein [Tsukamurella pseudospumae]|nr:hypothetical protein [Tsukamurella pseudospumae]